MSLLATALSLRALFDQKFRATFASYSRLETTADDTVIVGKDGCMVSVIRLDGTRVMSGPDEFDDFLTKMTISLGNYLDEGNHAFELYIERDPETSSSLVGELYSDARNVMERVGLDLGSLLSAREKHLKNLIVDERSYLALWTFTSVLTPKELRNIGEDTKPPSWWPADSDAQLVFRSSQKMLDHHKSFVESVSNDFSSAGMRQEVLNVTEALRAIRRTVDRTGTARDWCPSTPYQTRKEKTEDQIRKSANNKGGSTSIHRSSSLKGDVTDSLWSRLDDQIFSIPGIQETPQNLKIGPYVFAGMDLTSAQRQKQSFNKLIRRMRMSGKEPPWRARFLLQGQGVARLSLRRTLAAIFQITNPENKIIKESIDELTQRAHSEENLIVGRVQISFATWAPVGEKRLLEERLSRLQSAVEGWGHCETTVAIGDPLAAFMSSTVGINTLSTAPAGAGPVKEIMGMQPWQRDSSPYQTGPVLFRTPDGRVWPFDIAGTITASDFHLVVGASGGGKSVLLNTFNLGACLSPLQTAGTGGFKLPRIAMIDYGPTSKGLISLISENLPAGQEHLAVYKRLRYDDKHIINPCDLPLGNRKPPVHQKDMLVNLVCQLATDPSAGKPPEGLAGLASTLVDEIFEAKSDRNRDGNPKPYAPGDYLIDAALKKYGALIDDETTWYQVVDYLAKEKKDYHMAYRAQRYAVPLIADLMYVMNYPKVRDIYEQTPTESGEPLLNAFRRMISEALRDYKVFSAPSTFDLGDARIVSLDIDECCGDATSPAGRKKTSIACLLARFATAGDFYLIQENITEFEPDYREYHAERVQRLNETKKMIIMDEVHKTKGCPGPRNQIVLDGRVGRKFGVIVVAASQMPDDFDKEMVGLSTAIWVTGTANANETKTLAANADLSAYAQEVINHMGRPTARGAPVFTSIKTRSGFRHEHFLYNSLGPQEIWALQTDPHNSLLRELLAKKVGYKKAWEILSQIFPEGSAESTISKRINAAIESGDVKDDEGQKGVVATMAEELAQRSFVQNQS
ncbi:hypothetical protein [Acetobacter persici]|uniref:Type IV secretion protein DotO n=1 Tax=Acetobacter persici TaxID=1076596 RepID=A0A1U9LIW7_9PROT|nr:hypothetical protein [Acetobacter persici]AQT06372.1 hypothetical protein A0U91_15265 [Acetobacter persici]